MTQSTKSTNYKTAKKTQAAPNLSRYLLTGGAIGLYFGWFFRPVREANFVLALALAVLVAVVMTAIYAVRARPSFSTLPLRFGLTFVKAALVLSVLEGRHLAFDWGGRTAVIIFTVVTGAATGLWFAYEQSRQPLPASKKQK